MPEDKLFFEIYKFGTYYFPANTHYGGPGEVGCDRCLRTDIAACIGWGDHDMCLACISEINTKYEDGDLIIYEDSDSE